jgi:hypothetical protein
MTPNKNVRFGDYLALHCLITETGREWWRVYKDGVRDALSDHATVHGKRGALAAMKRYAAGDERRARDPSTFAVLR